MASPIANTFEGGSNNTTISAANSGGASGTAVASITVSGSSTVQFSTAFTRGTMAMRCTFSSSAAGYATWSFVPTATTTRFAMRFYIYIPTGQASTTQDLIYIRNATTVAASLGLNSSSRLVVKNTVAGTRATSNQPLPNDTWIRIEFAFAVGAASNTGTLECSFYLGDSLTPVQALYSGIGTEQCGTTAISGIRLGTVGSVASARSIYYDDFAARELVSGFIGPNQVTLDGTITTTASISAAATRDTSLSGSVSATGSIAGTGALAFGLGGEVSAGASFGGDATRNTGLTGDVPIESSSDGQIERATALAAVLGIEVEVAAAMLLSIDLASNATWLASFAGQVSRETFLASSLQGALSVEGILERATALGGDGDWVLDLQAALERATTLDGEVATQFDVGSQFDTFAQGELVGLLNVMVAIEAVMLLEVGLGGEGDFIDDIGGGVDIEDAPGVFDLGGAVAFGFSAYAGMLGPVGLAIIARLIGHGRSGRLNTGSLATAVAVTRRARMIPADRVTTISVQSEGTP